MAAYVETGTMAHPEHYSSKQLNHLGLVAGMYDEMGIGELIDQLIIQDGDKRTVSLGQAVKGMILNGLGFTHRALYLTPLFFRDKPVDRLIGEGIEAEHLNDDVLGRALDKIYSYDPEALYSQLSIQAIKRLGLSNRFVHLDSTSFHVDGVYNSGGQAEDGVIHITKGYSRDHRPDLNQVVLQLICERQAGIPIMMETLSGNNSDKTSFRDMINAHIEQMHNDFEVKYLIADSALYVAETLKDMQDTLWISRAPESLSLSCDIIHSVAPDLMDNPSESAYRSLGVVYGDVKQRWVVIYSPEARQRVLKSVNKHCLKQSLAEFKAFDTLCKQAFACETDAYKALALFEKKQKTTFVSDVQVVAQPCYQGKGRPKKDKEPDYYLYHIEAGIASNPQERTRRLERKSCFILATNQLNCDLLSDEELIAAYKDQQKVERGFRFLKDPLFMASTVFLKSPKRIMALMMVMTLCLLVYAALEHRIREALKTHDMTFPDQKGDRTEIPSARWVFQYFSGIHVLTIAQLQVLVLNMNEYHTALLKLLGAQYEMRYSGYG
jgi:transposase